MSYTGFAAVRGGPTVPWWPQCEISIDGVPVQWGPDGVGVASCPTSILGVVSAANRLQRMVMEARVADLQTRIYRSKRRSFGRRTLLLWTEDAPERRSLFVRAQDECSGACGHLEIRNSDLHAAYTRFAQSRHAGRFAAHPSCGTPTSAAACYPADALLTVFLDNLLDAVIVEANPFGDEWTLRLLAFDLSVSNKMPGMGSDPGIGPPMSIGQAQFRGAGPLPKGDLEPVVVATPGMAPAASAASPPRDGPVGAGATPRLAMPRAASPPRGGSGWQPAQSASRCASMATPSSSSRPARSRPSSASRQPGGIMPPVPSRCAAETTNRSQVLREATLDACSNEAAAYAGCEQEGLWEPQQPRGPAPWYPPAQAPNWFGPPGRYDAPFLGKGDAQQAVSGGRRCMSAGAKRARSVVAEHTAMWVQMRQARRQKKAAEAAEEAALAYPHSSVSSTRASFQSSRSQEVSAMNAPMIEFQMLPEETAPPEEASPVPAAQHEVQDAATPEPDKPSLRAPVKPDGPPPPAPARRRMFLGGMSVDDTFADTWPSMRPNVLA
eukprot:TRINITY_DN38821_c0_g1_i1.p1 TRINITY_DN38821_c0_g1~~TRINITY_DN38821_c0_g1_i1.p1  ORF type:complete len:552 (+),score=84.70 TRINITY_DN38821_c0_g1_i1:107-1762(+)